MSLWTTRTVCRKLLLLGVVVVTFWGTKRTIRPLCQPLPLLAAADNERSSDAPQSPKAPKALGFKDFGLRAFLLTTARLRERRR